ncbi:MAG: lysoplasmalogenase [Anaerolineaceae bacterium]|nr:lysoplasmalogenase [Anaerolineaceae bacterium]
MIPYLVIVLGLIMPLEWVAAGKRWIKVRFITKPLSLILLILIFSLLGGWVQAGFWFGAGLLFSLVGDVFLLLRSRFFIAGLFSFLIAHLLYIIGFSFGTFNLNGWGLIPLLLVIGLVIVAYPRIVGGVRRRLEHRRLWLPVVLYMVTITIMFFSAMMTWFRDQWTSESALIASVGALLFTISDTLLATGRFLRPVPYGNFLVMFTYHLGQIGIATGALLMLGLL